MNWKVTTVNVVLLLGMAGLGYGWGHASHVNHSISSRVRTTQQSTNQAAQSLQSKQTQIKDDFQRNALHNPDANIRSVFLRNQVVNQASPTISKFFDTYYSFNDSQDYNSRSQSLLKQGVITESLAHDKNVFSSDEISKGTNYVDVAQLNASFDSAYSFFPQVDKSNGTFSVLTQVKYDGNYTGQNPATNTVMYRVTYDSDQHRITGVQQEAMLYKSTNALDGLKNSGFLTNY